MSKWKKAAVEVLKFFGGAAALLLFGFLLFVLDHYLSILFPWSVP